MSHDLICSPGGTKFKNNYYVKKMNVYICLLFFIIKLSGIICLENGLALTPPMGWLSWERFKCNLRCDIDPSNCISENLFMQMADRLVSDGYKDAGYEYINIDDCWMARRRDKDGNMVADPVRFSKGIRFLADYMHARGLKLGIYQDFGDYTCMGFPGIVGHMGQDAKKFEEWDIDMVKLDGCHSDYYDLDDGYISFGQYLQEFSKPVLYSCSWPYYQLITHKEPDYSLISSHCNIWRNYHDIQDSWKSIEGVIDFYGDNQDVLAHFIGPGRWSDPDMLMIGNHRLTVGQSRAQMAVWSMIPGPLLMSNDLRDIKPKFKAILINRKVIAINQDPLGFPGKRIYKKNKLEVWKRRVMPAVSMEETSYALLFLNRHNSKKAVVKFFLNEFDLESKYGYNVSSLFDDKMLGFFQTNETLKITVFPMDVIMMHCVLKNA